MSYWVNGKVPEFIRIRIWRTHRLYNRFIFFLMRILIKCMWSWFMGDGIYKNFMIRDLSRHMESILIDLKEIPPMNSDKLVPVHLKVEGDTIKALMPRVTKFVEYDLSKDYQPIISTPWSQFPEPAWGLMLDETFAEMVKLWNKKHSKIKIVKQ